MNLFLASARNNATNLPVQLQSDTNGVLQVNVLGSGGTYPTGNLTETVGTVGTTSSALATPAAGAITKFLEIQNNNASGTLYVNFGTAATNTSRQIAAGQSWLVPVLPQQTINLLASTGTLNYVVTWA
jgi:hypothetical protein